MWSLICFLSIGRFALDLIPLEISGLRVNQIFLYIIFAMYVLARSPSFKLGQLFRGGNPWLFALALWAIASSFWAVTQLESLVKGLTFLLVALGCVLFSQRLSPEDTIRGALLGAFAAIAVSVGLAVSAPDTYGTTPFHDGAWRGMYEQKNVLGRGAMLGLVFLYTLRTANSIRLGLMSQLLIGSIFALALIKSQSASSLVGAVLFVSMLRPATMVLAGGPRLRLFFVMAAPVLCVVFVLSADAALGYILQATGKDEDLTGRVPLWLYALGDIAERPFLGYGLDSFFIDSREGALTMAVGWTPDQSHNGFLDMILELGVVGLVLLGGALISAFRRLPYAKPNSRAAAVVGVSVLLLLFAQNLTESNLYRSSNLIWLILSISVAHLSVPKRAPLVPGQAKETKLSRT